MSADANLLVRTLLGDVAPETLGLTLSHDHIFARPPADVVDPDLRLDDLAASVRELQDFAQVGGGSVIEMTTVDYGRDAVAMAAASRDTGVHLIAATGFNQAKFADRLSGLQSTADIAAWMTHEVLGGLSEGGGRAGLIKASSSLDGPTPDERRVFEAAIEAHRCSGAPIATHTEQGTWALEQAHLLLGSGVSPQRILIGHLDLCSDVSSLLRVADTGVYLSLDQFGKTKYRPDTERVRMIAELVRNGHGAQVMVGGDMARRSYWRAHGGQPGYRHIPTTVRTLLREELGEPAVRAMLFDTPAQFLAWVAA